MILNYAKKLAIKMVEQPIRDCVITVPSHYSLGQRNSLISAIRIAGLNPTGLIFENSAAALYYALER